MEESRQQPIDQDSFTKSLNESKDLCEAHNDYTKQGGIFEEFPFYGYGPPTLYPMPRTYAASSIDSDQIGFEGSIEPAIRDTVLRLKSVKKPDESVVYNQMKKEALPDLINFFLERIEKNSRSIKVKFLKSLPLCLEE